jgi:hypothetical protein
MRRKVTLRDEFGDTHYGTEHPSEFSDLPSMITVNGTNWWPETWRRHGWSIIATGDWEE